MTFLVMTLKYSKGTQNHKSQVWWRTHFDCYIKLILKSLIAELTEEKKEVAIFMDNFLILQDESCDVSWNTFRKCKTCLEAAGQYFQTLIQNNVWKKSKNGL